MPFRLDVAPPLLSTAGLRQQVAGDRLAAIATALEAAGSDASSAAGEPALAGTLGELTGAGGQSIRTVGVSVSGLGTNLGAASDAYLSADHSSMGGG